MSYFLFDLILFFILRIIFCEPYCEENLNNCIKCNPLTNLCVKCEKDNLTPDDKGGCKGKEICKSGKHYCLECDSNDRFCEKCQEGYLPDENGGCSYTDNCQYSYNGECLKCLKDFILIGNRQGLRICKFIYSDDFKYCEKIDFETGLCKSCEENYYLNEGDHHCSKTVHCSASSFGICEYCNEGYYLNKKEELCLPKEKEFVLCIETLDGITCDKCDDNAYLSEDGNCTYSNYCSKAKKETGICIECIPGRYLIYDVCTTEKNCAKGDLDTGLCNLCKENFYLDYFDRKCKSNKMKDEYLYCILVNENECIQCESGYYLGEDKKCSNTKNCLESEGGKCIECSDNFYLGLDFQCTTVNHCIYSNLFYDCLECENNYYLNLRNQTCMNANGIFKNCKLSNTNGDLCYICKDNFYNSRKDYLCYDNTNKSDIFYKCLYTDQFSEKCSECVDNYYLGGEDNLCSKNEGCLISKNENECIKCDDGYCLDLSNGKCEENDMIWEDSKKIYFRCNYTNEEGTKCEKCLNGTSADENGLCIDNINCEEFIDGVCVKCKDEFNGDFVSYCLNNIYGCVETLGENCLRCDDIFNFHNCTECMDGYEIDQNYFCRQNSTKIE